MSGALENRWALECRLRVGVRLLVDQDESLAGQTTETRGPRDSDRGPGSPECQPDSDRAGLSASGWGQWRGRAARAHRRWACRNRDLKSGPGTRTRIQEPSHSGRTCQSR